MKKTNLLVTIATSFFLLSCSENDELKLTKKEGQPSLFELSEQNNETKIYFSYNNDQITQIKENNGSTGKYTYENKIPSEIIYGPPTGAADGNGATRFINEGDSIIRVESWGEPSSLLYVKEIALDKDRNPVKITEIGAFALGSEGRTKEREGEKYTLITLDPTTKKLLKREVYCIENSELLGTYTYQYDNNPGTMSYIDWPLWLFIYTCDGRSTFYDSCNRQFFNYKNNLIQETVSDKIENKDYTVNYTYTYNENGYPLTASNDKYQEKNDVTIRY